jgi:hypothetical protein
MSFGSRTPRGRFGSSIAFCRPAGPSAHAFVKRTEQTPLQELALARARKPKEEGR